MTGRDTASACSTPRGFLWLRFMGDGCSRRRTLSEAKGSVRRIAVDGVFDIETSKWDQFLCGGMLDRSGSYFAVKWRRENDLVDKLLSENGNWLAHAGGRFDFSWLLTHAVRRGIPCRVQMAGSRVIYAKLGRLTLSDSYALVPMSLEKFTAGMGVEKAPYPLPCLTSEHGPYCRGFCRFKRDMPAADLAKVMDYMELDCRSLYAALTHLQEWASDHQLDLGPTIGGSAWRHAQRFMDLPNCELSRGEAAFVRRAYYGGRTQVFRPLVSLCHEADVVSMYPNALHKLSLPFGQPKLRLERPAACAFEREEAGIYQADIEVAEEFIPPLPVRTKERIAYPYGLLRGTWTGLELQYAVERGARVRRVRSSLTWHHSANAFAPWVDHLFTLRREAGKKTPIGEFLKTFSNSITGKLGQQPEGRTLYTTEDGKPHNIHHEPIGPFFEQKTHLLHPCSHPEWAALLTSYSRVLWHRMATIDGAEDMVYGDTDSTFTLNKRGGLGDGLGQFEDKGEAEDFDCIAPKFYRFRRGGRTVIRSKGIGSVTDPEFDEISRDGARAFSREGVRGLAGAARRSSAALAGGAEPQLLQATTLTRRVTRGYGDRLYVADAHGGHTRARHVGDFEIAA